MAKLTAKTADKFVLYSEAVQSPEAEVTTVDRMFRKYRGVLPTRFREDFCGTALISCEWVKKRRENEAWGVDLDQPTLDWARKNSVGRLPPDAARRVHFLNRNVLEVTEPKVEVVGAFNFSYFVFKTHRELTAYFRKVRASLTPNGMFILDGYGGFESQQVLEEETKCNGFIYIWDQAKYNPIDDTTLCHIHFRFPDGSEMRRAFSYDWRLWTLGGIRDALTDAGFSQADAYWEGTDRKGAGNGVYRRQVKAENSAGWNAYFVALP